MKILLSTEHLSKYLSLHNLLIDPQYGFHRARSTDDLPVSLLSISHPLLEILVKLLLFHYTKLLRECGTKLWFLNSPPTAFILVSNFISSFLSDRSIAAMVDGHCSSPESVNSCQILSCCFINDLVN